MSLPGNGLLFDRDGNPLDLLAFCELFEDPDYRRIASSHVVTADGIGVDVSTVWLGIDHRFTSAGAPLIFETMTFLDEPLEDGTHAEFDSDLVSGQWRYATEAEARAGHEVIVATLGVPSEQPVDLDE